MGLRKALRMIAESGWTLVGGGTVVGALGNKLFPLEVLLSASLVAEFWWSGAALW